MKRLLASTLVCTLFAVLLVAMAADAFARGDIISMRALLFGSMLIALYMRNCDSKGDRISPPPNS